MTRTFLKSIGVLIALLVISGAQAYTLETIAGDDVEFTYDKDTAFGSALVIGNSIFFQPTTFKAESLDGAGPVTNNVTLNVTVEVTTPGYVLDEFLMIEQGDYELHGVGASVVANGQFSITSQTTNCIAGIFPCRHEEIFDAGPLTVKGALTAWNASASIDLADTAGWGEDTKVTMTLENKLKAQTLNSGVGEQAFIEKKFGAVGIIVNPVPIPSAVWLFGGAIGLLGWMRRRVG